MKQKYKVVIKYKFMYYTQICFSLSSAIKEYNKHKKNDPLDLQSKYILNDSGIMVRSYFKKGLFQSNNY